MRRIVAAGVAAVLLLGLAGCGGDSDEGMPKDVDVKAVKSIDINPLDTMKMKTKGAETKSAKP